jgi:hypothetical protein
VALRALQKSGADAPRIYAEKTDIDDMLAYLFQLKIAAEDQAWIKKVEQVLNGLPTAGNPQTCTGLIREGQRFSNVFRWWDVGLEHQGAIRTKGDLRSQSFDLPNPNEEPVVFRFYDYPPSNLQKDLPYYKLPISGPWACILMLHNKEWSAEKCQNPMDPAPKKEPATLASSASRDEDGKTWRITLSLPHERDTEAVATIELKFKAELPRITDWPSRRPEVARPSSP